MTENDLQLFTENFSKNYNDFRVSERILLTGHSHQAWPDIAKNGILKCWDDAASKVDDKWGAAFEKADKVRSGFMQLINDKDGFCALSSNTHDLLIKFLSAINLKNKPKIITTDMEFHTVRRQLDRLAEENIEVVKEHSNPHETLVERIIRLIDDKTACVIISKVFFKSGRIVDNLGLIEEKCISVGAYLLVDVYHALNIIDFDIATEGLSNSYLIGGGYKYCQLGEGNCFMRFPESSELRPVITGWFSEFTKLADVKIAGEVAYGEGHYRFAGSTYDPVSHYRASEVFDFFQNMNITPKKLREISLLQLKILADGFDNLNIDEKYILRDTNNELNHFGGFLVLKSKFADIISRKLAQNNVLTDFREEYLRLGPAPYVTIKQLNKSIEAIDKVVNLLKKEL